MMQYRDFGNTGEKLSLLGLGAMRLPQDSCGRTDHRESVRLIRRAIDCGINYIDTAYTYQGGESETVLGEALKDGYREKVMIADKMPAWLADDSSDIEKMFELQFRRLETGCIDMYLIHNITGPIWNRAQKFGLLPFLEKKKKEGRIRYLGFSFHDDIQLFRQVLDCRDWDFCQIQLNYMDTEKQAGLSGLIYAGEKGVPVIIMEPLKGGRLADAVPATIQKIWDRSPEKRSPAEWGLRWVGNLPQVNVILSGMSSIEQLEENIGIIERCTPGNLSAEDRRIIKAAAEEYDRLIQYPCTDCRYCMPCPQNVNIPRCIALYNEWFLYEKNPSTMLEYSTWMDKDQHASGCIKCGLCEEKCPQHIHIREALEKTAVLFGD